jgi:hypothetical protein
LGVVETASVDGTRGVADLRFSERPEVQGVMADVGSGVIRSVSAGYTVQKWEVSKRGDGARLKTATRWTPVEVSFTPLAADAGAQTRSKKSMNEELQTQIRSIGAAVGISTAFVDDVITRHLSLDAARSAIIQEAARQTPTIDGRNPSIVTREAEPDEMVRHMADALYHRVNPTFQPAEQARPYVGRRLVDMARELLRVRGLNALGSDAEVITRSLNTTSDFPNLLANITNKVLAAQYQLAPSGIKVVCKRATVGDFKPRNIIRRGELPTLEKVNEKGEFKRGSIVDGKESYSIDTFGKVFGMTRKALINDDLGALADIASGWAMAAQEFENQFLVTLLTSNAGAGPILSDSKAVFHTGHANLAGTGAVISDTTLSVARLALRTQKGLNGITPINATPKYLVVPAAQETAAEHYLATLYPNAPSGVNPFSGTLSLVVEPRLDAVSTTGWYVFADPAVLPVIEYAYLQGFEGLHVETRLGFDTDGVEIKARLDFGGGGLDFRGAYKNPGA